MITTNELSLEEVDLIIGRNKPLNHSEIEIAWAAGLFEGEGTSYITGSQARLELTSTDKDIVERFHRIMGCGNVHVRATGQVYKTQYRWCLNKRDDVVEVLTILIPWLGKRRQEMARQVLDQAIQNKGRMNYPIDWEG